MRFIVFQHVKGEGLGLFGEFLTRWGIRFDTVALYDGERIPSLADYDALLVLGGPMNVYEIENHPFLAAEERAIKQMVANGKPYLGICLGAQLLAKALGASVMANSVREIGFSHVELTADAMSEGLFKGLPRKLLVFQWHGDTFTIPKGGTRLAGSEHCSNQAFVYGRNAYGLQFHLEMTPDMVRAWIADGEAEIKRPGRPLAGELSPSDLQGKCAQLERLEEVVLSNFCEEVMK